MTKDVEPLVITDIPAAYDILLDRGSSALAFLEPVPSTDSAGTIPCPIGPNHLDPIPPNMRGDDLPDAVPNTKKMETSQLSCTPYVTAPVPTPEQANCVSSNLSMVGDFRQELAKRRLSTIEPSDSGDYENDSEPSQISNLGEDPCLRANKASGRAKDPSTTKDTLAISSPSSPPPDRSISIYSRARTTLSSKPLMRYPSIAMIIPLTSWKQGAARISIRAATAVYKKRLRSDGNTTYDIAQPCQKRKKRRPSIRPLSNPSESSVPISSHCSGAIQGIRGSAILTVESNTSLKPAYFFTFIPDPSPMLSRAHTAVILGKHTYTSDENALLVRLKEKEAMSWSEITTHFPGRNMSSLQVHYSTKLRHKASSRYGKPRRRE
ncbi:Protein of unknown function DUF3435 [Penicillium samsonianum]|uniref:Protein of unknown function DUF3435 n=1 Tax=Penicillium samsonianum TaxID=1882272 RepID=UPI002546FF9C|nr:Protein of unknown function DUF3435 [Penicillium samsonianum]KAJ6142821.1 Protein of unknown function DUF3435 [Penicillium samsonianum]